MPLRLPALRPADMVRVLEKAGFRIVRQTGSHIILHKEGMERPIPIPVHPGHLKRKLQDAIIRESGIAPETFRRLL